MANKRNKSQANDEGTLDASADTVTAIVKPNAPFDVLKYGEYEVSKNDSVTVPSSITEHRNSSWLLIS